MKLKYLSLGVLFAGSTMSAGAQTLASQGGDKVLREPLTLTGCVAAGTKAYTFLLTNVQRIDSSGRDALEKTVYWLSSPDKLKGHTGHQVEIEGELDEDVDKSEMKTESGKVEVTTERNSRKVEVAENTVAGDAIQALGTSGRMIVSYKVNVKSVKMVSAECPPEMLRP